MATASDQLKLHVSFEGTAPGLAERRLSVGAFGDALQKLLRAYRRIASGLIRDALDKPGYGERGGGYTIEARALDLELARITHHSPVELEFVCAIHPYGAQMQLFENGLGNGLMERAGVILLESLEAEGHQELRHARVREFLEALPPGVTRQRYQLRRGSKKPIKAVELSDVAIARAPETLPVLAEFEGDIVGVGFDPGTTEVRVRHAGATTILPANAQQVEQALAMRATTVRALALRGKLAKLIRLVPAGRAMAPSNPKEIVAQIDDRWAGLLKKLAQ